MTYHADHPRHCNRNASRRRRAFTLVEVMISVALVLLLMYGVSQVFKMSGDAVGANQAVSKIIRDHRAAAATMAEDFRNCAADSPLFLISSRIAYNGPAGTAYNDTVDGNSVPRGFRAGFANAEAQRNNQGGPDPTNIDGIQQPFIQLGGSDRVPRIDRLSFFTRALYRRQSVSNNPPASLSSSAEAYVTYGHTACPKPINDAKWQAYSGGFRYLLPENQFGADRILGRLAILLRDSGELTTAAASNAPWMGQSAAANPLWPLSYGSHPFECDPMHPYSDVAATTIDQFRQDADGFYYAAGGGTNPDWFRPMEDSLPPTVTMHQIMRYWCDPKISRPITSQSLSQTVPYFVGNCTQFIVEYAGDYLKQDENDAASATATPPRAFEPGWATDALSKQDLMAPYKVETGETDGQIDYIIDTSTDRDPATGNPYNPPQPAGKDKWVRRIRWYGLPRDINGDGKITINDVVPLADVLDYYGIAHSAHATPLDKGKTGAAWENINDLPNPRLKDTRSSTVFYKPWQYNYADVNKVPITAAPKFKYTCAWHNDAPPLIRVLVKIDDPTGKLQDGQWYEYIFSR